MLQYHHEKKLPLPVNLVFCFEGMEESGSEGLDELVRRESLKGGYFDGVDCVCIVSTPVPLAGRPRMNLTFALCSSADHFWLIPIGFSHVTHLILFMKVYDGPCKKSRSTKLV